MASASSSLMLKSLLVQATCPQSFLTCCGKVILYFYCWDASQWVIYSFLVSFCWNQVLRCLNYYNVVRIFDCYLGKSSIQSVYWVGYSWMQSLTLLRSTLEEEIWFLRVACINEPVYFVVLQSLDEYLLFLYLLLLHLHQRPVCLNPID